MDRRLLLDVQGLRRVVIKIGTSSVTTSEGRVNGAMIAKLREEIRALHDRNIQTILVTSGAVGVGRSLIRDVFRLPVMTDPSIARRQALSAIGQSHLMAHYGSAFETLGRPVAQLLLTARDFRDRRAYVNIGHTIEELQRIGAVAIVNENDTVSTDELQFGDNDLLSAAVAALFHADLLCILTSVEGFLFEGRRAPYLPAITAAHRAAAGGPEGPGRGGMATKLRAGELCMLCGSKLAILPAGHPSPLQALLAGEDIGTVVAGGRTARLSARKRWLLFARTEGAVRIDAGAVRALSERGSSLLPAGIRALSGRFLAGDPIEIETLEGRAIGRGIVNYSYREIQAMLGLSGAQIKERGLSLRADEVVHRNNLIIEQSSPVQ